MIQDKRRPGKPVFVNKIKKQQSEAKWQRHPNDRGGEQGATHVFGTPQCIQRGMVLGASTDARWNRTNSRGIEERNIGICQGELVHEPYKPADKQHRMN